MTKKLPVIWLRFDCAFERRKSQGHLEESTAERSRLNMARARKLEPIVPKRAPRESAVRIVLRRAGSQGGKGQGIDVGALKCVACTCEWGLREPGNWHGLWHIATGGYMPVKPCVPSAR